jgi:hypothetical protein
MPVYMHEESDQGLTAPRRLSAAIFAAVRFKTARYA